MLSILIPTYNYSVSPLILELKSQADLLTLPYEIIVLDDSSSLFLAENQKIKELENCYYLKNETNIGRTATRNLLAKKATFNNLLFLDADVFPEKKAFLSNYSKMVDKLENTVIFGGYKYVTVIPEESKSLRYYYGKDREEKEASIRNKNPYGFVFSGNMLICKNIFLENNYKKSDNLYGLDNIFSHQLYTKNIKALHIDNGIFHNGLEENEVFFTKSLESVTARKQILSNDKKGSEINSLLRYYSILKKIKLLFVAKILFKWSEKYMKNKIIAEKPNLFYFDLYRLGYICSLEN
ncbi:glycosyltransferase family 2 protein [Flavobacterium ardleyense]|uniref:Glycosyltransferase family 2 protein n=1 Tax=Flavobacterium ardleyense TaxID=2038737 RepID=A0ABW5Z577_9FLAO